MHCPAMVYADAELISALEGDGTLKQLKGVASLPGIIGPALAMPDAHQGYGFPIGGVGAFDPRVGLVSPGGVGYDINCGVRLLRSKLAGRPGGGRKTPECPGRRPGRRCPPGWAWAGRIKLSDKGLKQILTQGAAWAVGQGPGHGGRPGVLRGRRRLARGRPCGGEPPGLAAGPGPGGQPGGGQPLYGAGAGGRSIFDPQVSEAFRPEPRHVGVVAAFGLAAAWATRCATTFSSAWPKTPTPCVPRTAS